MTPTRSPLETEMSDSALFPSVTPRHALPLLFTSQAQKEVFHNEALARIDALLHAAVEGKIDTPPADAESGRAWLVGSAPTGAWIGHENEIALRQSGQWIFATPVAGLRIFDLAAKQFVVFTDAWQKADAVAEPTGGLTVDSEARAAIGALLLALRAASVLPSV